MDVNIEQMSSKISIADTERIAETALKKMRQAQEHERQLREEREFRPGVSSRDVPNWG